jgi:hypothetical protein
MNAFIAGGPVTLGAPNTNLINLRHGLPTLLGEIVYFTMNRGAQPSQRSPTSQDPTEESLTKSGKRQAGLIAFTIGDG